MPDIQLIGFTEADATSEFDYIRRRLRDFPQADKLNLVWFKSKSESLVGAKPAPFLRIQGRKEALADFEEGLVDRLTRQYDIKVAHNERWIPRGKMG